MKEVILHIGTHKSGSTSIQEAIHKYDDGKTRSARFPYANHSIASETIFSKHVHEFQLWVNNGLSLSQIDQKKNDFLKILNRDLMDPNCNRLIISAEKISTLDKDDKLKLIKYLRSKEVEIRVVCYVRSPLDFTVSAMHERIRSGNLDPKVPLAYQAKIEPFIEELGKENVFVFNYDELVANRISVVDHFAFCRDKGKKGSFEERICIANSNCTFIKAQLGST